VPAGVEVLRRSNENSDWLFLLNHSAEKVSVPLDGHGRDLLTGAQVDGMVELEPAGIVIIQVEDI
jgi:beta-galactosidase